MTYVIEQPDSPIEILAADFKDSFLSVVNDRYSEQLRCTIKVRNRSDQPVRGFDTRVQVTTGGYAHAGGRNFLAGGRADRKESGERGGYGDYGVRRQRHWRRDSQYSASHRGR
jgi:hypothetical protein